MKQNDFPRKLYKAFKERDYLECFLRGSFRMMPLAYYKSIGDKDRNDNTEGTAKYGYPDTVEKMHFTPGKDDVFTTNESGIMLVESSSINPIYVFCTSTSEVNLNHLKIKYGPYIAIIDNPYYFQIAIEQFIKSNYKKLMGGINSHHAKYTKDLHLDKDPGVWEGIRLAKIQKPTSHSTDCEFRYIAEFSGTEEIKPYLNINIGEQSYINSL